MQGTVDSNNVTLFYHILELFDTVTANFFRLLFTQRLVVEVEELLAVKRFKSAQDALTDTTNTNGTNDLVLEIILLLGDGSNIPVTSLHLLVGGNKVSNQYQDGHNNVLSNRDDITASDFGDRNTAISLVGKVKVDVV